LTADIFDQVDETPDGRHRWLVINGSCTPSDADDPLVMRMITSVRRAYREDEILALAEPDPSVGQQFNLDAIRRAIRAGLPAPESEGSKPPQLRNSRSEASELIARDLLQERCGVRFPASPQAAKLNANQPILGFDGWGFTQDSEGRPVLTLVLVKATDQDKSPPDVADDLAVECTEAALDISAICRALSVLAILLAGTDDAQVVLSLLELAGIHASIPLILGPTILRGLTTAKLSDMAPLRALSETHPASFVGLVVSIGADLGDFGSIVFKGARAA
jgi:hypothetical protein